MDVETAIRTRRTHKAFGPEPLPREQLEELFELATWAPNHHLTAPWRFRVVGPATLARLKDAAGPEGAAKLDRCPTLVVVSAAASEDPVQSEEDLHTTAVAAYIVLLAAHARGLAGYWRSPGLLRGRGTRGRRPVRRRALRRPAPPRPAAPGAARPGPPTRHRDHRLPRLMSTRRHSRC